MRCNAHVFPTAGLLLLIMCGCQTAPKYSAISRPGLTIVNFRDVQRRNQIPAQTQFASADTIAVCAHGFAGRTVTVELWEQSRGFLKKWTEVIAAPRMTRTPIGITFQEDFGRMQPMRTERMELIEDDWVLRFERLPPGNYEVRLTSNAGHQDRAGFTVTK